MGASWAASALAGAGMSPPELAVADGVVAVFLVEVGEEFLPVVGVFVADAMLAVVVADLAKELLGTLEIIGAAAVGKDLEIALRGV